jgi:hypothetical protein
VTQDRGVEISPKVFYCPPSARWQCSRARRRVGGMQIVIGVDPHTRQRTLSRRDRRARRIGWAADFPGQPQRSAGPAQSGGQNSTSASELRWRPRSAPRSPKSSVSAQSWQRSAIVAIVGNVSRFPSKAHFASSEEAWHRSRPQAGRWSDTGSRLPATAASTRSHAHDRRVPGSQRSHARRGVPSS